MGEHRDDLDATRAETNTSLDAERLTAKSAAEHIAQIKRRLQDDLIDVDRLRADERLFKFRASADALLARDRLASPWRGPELVLERYGADLNKEAEREVTDGILDSERKRYNDMGQADQAKHGAEDVQRQLRERDTDTKLGAERSYVDTVQVEPASSPLARASSESRQYRDVLAMVSHDLRNPLTAIGLSAGFLLNGALKSDTQEIAEDIVLAAASMERLLSNLLDVARMEAAPSESTRGSTMSENC